MLGYNPLKICKMLPCGDSFTPTSECLRYLIQEGVIIIMCLFFTQASEGIGMACYVCLMFLKFSLCTNKRSREKTETWTEES